MIRNMNNIDDFFSYIKERAQDVDCYDSMFNIEKMAEVIISIPEYKFLNINFKFGSKTWSWHSKGKYSGSLVEIDLYAERFGDFGYVIYSMERGGVRDLSYFSGSNNFVRTFISRIIKPEYAFFPQEISDLYKKME